ncbi:MAG: hypothetical protein JSU65_14230 [Candidatus Zixiibacteriota bacterium]|nr:MAG: hypothetical protein JSU65_14230 [candidate division Zixibacteria bacterium]
MVYCPKCEREWTEDVSQCPICGKELQEINDEISQWTKLGYIEDKISADFAVEVLKSYGIPAVVISRSGFFGQVGLPLNPFYSKEIPLFEISVLTSEVVEAAAILDMALGNRWQREDN